jgi:hypothetical protein
VIERWPPTRIVLSSGYADSVAGGGADLPPGVRFLPKPYRRAELAEVLRDVLAGKAQTVA